MTEKEKRSLKIRLGSRLSTDRPEVMEMVKEEIDKTPTTTERPHGDNKEALFVLNHLFYDCDNMTQKEYDILLKAINTRPHGKWEEVPVKRDILHPNGIKYVCTACKRDNCYGKPPFCMYCGADMRKGGAE